MNKCVGVAWQGSACYPVYVNKAGDLYFNAGPAGRCVVKGPKCYNGVGIPGDKTFQYYSQSGRYYDLVAQDGDSQIVVRFGMARKDGIKYATEYVWLDAGDFILIGVCYNTRFYVDTKRNCIFYGDNHAFLPGIKFRGNLDEAEKHAIPNHIWDGQHYWRVCGKLLYKLDYDGHVLDVRSFGG